MAEEKLEESVYCVTVLAKAVLPISIDPTTASVPIPNVFNIEPSLKVEYN
jgi:hypothetical protein